MTPVFIANNDSFVLLFKEIERTSGYLYYVPVLGLTFQDGNI